MTPHTLNGYSLLVVDKPEGSSPFVDNVFGLICFRVYVNFKEVPHANDIKIPYLGQWQILSTEADWSKVVERWDSGKWNDYERFLARVDTALESGYSWLRSIGEDPDKVIVLLKIK